MATVEVTSVEKLIVDNQAIYRYHLTLGGNLYGTMDVFSYEIDEDTAFDPSRYGSIVRKFLFRRKP